MEERQRLKRPEPERTGPHRNFPLMYQRPGSDAHGASPQPDAASGPSSGGIAETVARGVRLAYRVIEEEIELGQRVARELNERSYGSGAMAGDFRDIGEAALQTWAKLGTAWLELLGSFTGSVRPGQHHGGEPAQRPGATEVWLDVTARQPVQVALDLHPHARGPLLVYELHAPQRSSPPLADVHLDDVESGRPATLRLRVPPGQPAGQYAGVVVDGAGNVRGTLAVRLGEPSRDSAQTT